MKKILILIFLLILIPVVKAEETEDLAPNAKSAIMIEASTGEILFQKNAYEKLPPASMTKMMSILLILEEIEKGNLKWDEEVVASENAASMGGSQIFLEAGEKMTVTELLKGISIASGNDATVAMAEKIAGTEEAFVKRMNERAKELVKHEKILEFTGTYEEYLRKDSDNPFWLVNTNRLVRFYKGVDGLKTGYTSSAGYCLTATAKRDDMRLITVVMNEPDTSKRSSDTTKMLDYGYNVYTVENIIDNSTTIDKKKVELGKKEEVDIISKETITILRKKSDKDRNIVYKANIDKIVAPVKKGDKVGTIDILEDNKVISTIEATVKEDINKASIFTILYRNIKNIVNPLNTI